MLGCGVSRVSSALEVSDAEESPANSEQRYERTGTQGCEGGTFTADTSAAQGSGEEGGGGTMGKTCRVKERNYPFDKPST